MTFSAQPEGELKHELQMYRFF